MHAERRIDNHRSNLIFSHVRNSCEVSFKA